MLAYVFWHWPRPGVSSAIYERNLIAFHTALAAQRSPGFLSSAVMRGQVVPWIAAQQPYYEDWYLVGDSAGLDPLDQAAVSGNCREPHDAVARAAGGGTGGLYRLRGGLPQMPGVRWATWLDKPEGQTYVDFYAALQPLTDLPVHSLWQRQMTLGPAREFCLFTADQCALPAGLPALVVPLYPVWPPAH